MAYLDVITLAEAKTYLRVDADLTDDDAQITLMIETALEFIETYTRVIVFNRTKVYLAPDGFIRVYDAPITAVTTPTEHVREQKTLHSIFTFDGDELSLEVGYALVADLPKWVKIVALELIAIYYFQKEAGEKSVLSALSQRNLDMNRRFIM